MKIIISNFLPHSKIEEADNGESCIGWIKKEDFDIIILDVNMPDTDSFGLVNTIVALKPESKILMFSMNDDQIYAKRYLKLGVKGYVRKDEPENEIKKAITQVLNNKKYISQRLSDTLIKELSGEGPENPFDKLSAREFEIVQHLAKGESLSEICHKLTLHPSTVGTHKARIFEKLSCNNIVELNTLAKIHHVLFLS